MAMVASAWVASAQQVAMEIQFQFGLCSCSHFWRCQAERLCCAAQLHGDLLLAEEAALPYAVRT
jgi:hypothetical protein